MSKSEFCPRYRPDLQTQIGIREEITRLNAEIQLASLAHERFSKFAPKAAASVLINEQNGADAAVAYIQPIIDALTAYHTLLTNQKIEMIKRRRALQTQSSTPN